MCAVRKCNGRGKGQDPTSLSTVLGQLSSVGPVGDATSTCMTGRGAWQPLAEGFGQLRCISPETDHSVGVGVRWVRMRVQVWASCGNMELVCS